MKNDIHPLFALALINLALEAIIWITLVTDKSNIKSFILDS